MRCDGKWHMMGVTLAAGGSLQWFRNGMSDVAAEAKKKKIDAYDVLTEEAAMTPPGSGAKGCCSSPTLRVSARRTPTPTRGGLSWG